MRKIRRTLSVGAESSEESPLDWGLGDLDEEVAQQFPGLQGFEKLLASGGAHGELASSDL